jgi:ABC-type transport system involved in multi-copper enzyme maturation permease subunit
MYFGRVLFLLALLAGLSLIWAPAGRTYRNFDEVSAIGTRFFLAVITIQLVVVLLASPAATAGAICVDKSRGTLLHVMVTDLGDREIVVGKLFARLAPVLALMVGGLPILALSGLLGGVDAMAAAGAYLVTIGVAIVGCALAMAFSVWARKTHQALLPTYGVLGLWIALYPLMLVVSRMNPAPPWTGAQTVAAFTNPFVAAFAPYIDPSKSWIREQAAFLLASCLAAMLLVLMAVGRLREVVLGQSARPARRERPGIPARVLALLPEPPLDGNPVLWREWHRKRPTRWTGRFWGVYTVVSSLASLGVILFYFYDPLGGVHLVAAQVNGWEVAIGLLLLSVSSAT